jgi:radical SAM superfamily enzyme YgiQ (UPF0313 family)
MPCLVTCFCVAGIIFIHVDVIILLIILQSLLFLLFIKGIMKVLLTTINVSYIHQNLAIRLLYALNRQHSGLEWKEFFMKNQEEEIADYCANYNLLAFSCYIWNIKKTLSVAERIKQKNPQAKILLGGPEVSYEWQDLMQNNFIDYLIIGEGEFSFSAFLAHYPLMENIPALVYRQGKNIVHNPVAGNFDLKLLSGINPYAFDNEVELANKIQYIESSRGCPYSCSFCLAGLDNNLRFLPMDTVKSNLLFAMQKGKLIKFLDRTFNAHKRYAIEIFQFILENRRPENIFQFEIKADTLHPEIVAFVKNNVPPGIFRFEVGIQTLNEVSNESAHRRQSFVKIKRVVEELRGIVDFHLDLIVGLPYDYFEDIKRSIEEVFALQATEIQLGFLKFLKGTPNRAEANEHLQIFDKSAPYQIIESKYLSKMELHELSLVEHVLDVYWNKPRAHNTLLYVLKSMSIFEFMHQLGLFAENRINFHQYSLIQLFDVLFQFANENYPDDKILHELIAIDYYLLHKVRPGQRYLTEVEMSYKNSKLLALAQNIHLFRFMVLPVSFGVDYWIRNKKIVAVKDEIVIKYFGTQFPEIIY